MASWSVCCRGGGISVARLELQQHEGDASPGDGFDVAAREGEAVVVHAYQAVQGGPGDLGEAQGLFDLRQGGGHGLGVASEAGAGAARIGAFGVAPERAAHHQFIEFRLRQGEVDIGQSEVLEALLECAGGLCEGVAEPLFEGLQAFLGEGGEQIELVLKVMIDGRGRDTDAFTELAQAEGLDALLAQHEQGGIEQAAAQITVVIATFCAGWA